MDRKAKQAVIGTSVAVLILVIVALVGLIKTLTPSKEEMPLEEYYNSADGEVTLILQDTIYETPGLVIDGETYVDYDTVVSEFNDRFYFDKNENILSYATPTELVRAEVGSNSYTVNKSKTSVDYQIVKTNGDDVYIALEFIALYSDISYETYESPDRVVINYKWGDYLYATVKKDTQVRYEASIKSDILEQVTKDQKLMLVDEDEESSSKFTKVITEDGVIGYVQSKCLNTAEYEELKSSYEAPSYSYITKDYTINLAWHQVTNSDANYNLLTLLDGTKGITTISPTWFSVSDKDGTVDSLASEDYVEKAHNQGIEVWALVDDFTQDTDIADVLTYTSARDKLVNNLVSLAIKYNLDGLNIDFEKITADSASAYLEFLRELSIKCRNNGIVLSVDNYVPASYNAFYDLEEQGEVVDYVIIMGYDEHHANSEEAGSVSSYSFFTNAITDALEEVPAERLVMALPFYTRVWEETTNEDGTTSLTSKAYAMQSAWDYMESNGAEPTWDDTTGQYYAEFTSDNVTYKCWLEEDESIENRMKAISEAGLGGVAEWRLGFEKSSVWNVILKYVN